MQRVAVTGGAGFIGSHLCDYLLQLGHEVLCIDSFQTGRKENIHRLMSHPRFEVVRQDVTQALALEVDCVYHLACAASPTKYQIDPIHTLLTNVLGTANVLEAARHCGARLLLASTSCVYGMATEHPQSEEYWGYVDPIGPRACYDEGKRTAEALCMDYSRTRGVSVRIARIFNTYGPRMQADDGRVVSEFIVAGLNGNPLRIFGDGMQTRSFCYVDDEVRGLVALMELDNEEAGPVNVGNPEEVTIRSLAERVLEHTGSTAFVTYLPSRDYTEAVTRCPDVSKAKRLLGWEPQVGLEDGLSRTVAYFRRCYAMA